MRTDQTTREFYKAWIDSPLGTMLAIADATALQLLKFVDPNSLESELALLQAKTKTVILEGSADPIKSIEAELGLYFAGKLTAFKTPIQLNGSPFQKLAWGELLRIPYGKTRSYGEQAAAIGKPSAYRAVSNANGANQFVIVVPCHRIINSDGKLGGYGGGTQRKQWLITHEQQRS